MQISGNINQVKSLGLCISCGTCAANCPKKCIVMKKEKYEVLPIIDEDKCINCNICSKVCPIQQIDECDTNKSISEYLMGNYNDILCAQAKDENILFLSQSGGVVTKMISVLLKRGLFESAFLVSEWSPSKVVTTQRFTNNDSLEITAKSRYVTVSHETTISYMIEHKNEKIIIVGTGCAIQGIINSINLHGLNRENYLLIGLFCDKTMHYGVYDYFSNHPSTKGRKIETLHFRSKETGSWPGNVRIYYTDGSYEDLSNKERMKVKDYFLPERCLYCLDKLNRKCDIAVGDNYIKANEDKKGVSSIILRTDLGKYMWDICKADFYWHDDAPNDFMESQVLERKELNYKFACMKGIYTMSESSIPEKQKKAYASALRKIEIGKSDKIYKKVNNDIKISKFKSKLKEIISMK